MPRIDLKQISRDFMILADRFDRFAAQDVKLAHIARNVYESKIRAARLVIEAIDGGAFPESGAEENGGWWDRSRGRIPGLFLTVFESIRWRKGELSPDRQPEYLKRVAGEWRTEWFLRLWTQTICSWLQRRFPNRFRHDAAQCDWAHLATDAQGHPVGKDGRRLRGRWYKNGKALPEGFKWKPEHGGGYRWQLPERIPYLEESYGEADWFALARIRAEVYADACRLLSELIGAAAALAVAESKGDATGLGGGNSPSRDQKPRKERIKRDVAERLIADLLMQRPHDTAGQVAEKVGCSVGVVAESPAWKLNQKRLRIAKQEGIDPKAVKLDERVVNAAGGGKMRQLHDHRQQADRIFDEIDTREQELFSQIGEYQKDHPDATPEQVACALRDFGCTARDVERRQAVLNRLASEQADDRQEDIDAEDPNTKRGTRRKWVQKRV